VLAVQLDVTECEAGWTPVPVRETVAGELVALLATVTLPLTLADVAGVNVTVIVALCPGVRICPVETPFAENPAPEMLTLETVTLEFPALVNVTPKELLPPILTLAKLRLVALAASALEAVPFELGFAGAPAPVNPTQPEMDKVIYRVARTTSQVDGLNCIEGFAATL
jgi:hypothetical protein